MSSSAADIEKLLPVHNRCLTEAIASEKVGHCLSYQAALLTSNFPFACKRSASKATSENRASNTGVVRAMALWDHCLWVSTPKCALTSCKVTSMAHLLTKSVTICRAVNDSSVESKAVVLSLPAGSRKSTQRIGSASLPEWYHQAVPVASNIVFWFWPYHSEKTTSCQVGSFL